MKLRQFQVDAFAARPFEGNPAAVVPLANWLPDELILDLHTLALPADLPNGRYTLMTGLYDSISGQRLPLQDGTGADAIVLGSIAIEQP